MTSVKIYQPQILKTFRHQALTLKIKNNAILKNDMFLKVNQSYSLIFIQSL